MLPSDKPIAALQHFCYTVSVFNAVKQKMSVFRQILAWLSPQAFVQRYEQRQADEMNKYLSQAQSISELEHLQRKWDRRHQGGALLHSAR